MKLLSAPKFVSDIKGRKIKDIITLMLNNNLSSRLQNIKQIKTHPFFEKFDWVRSSLKTLLFNI